MPPLGKDGGIERVRVQKPYKDTCTRSDLLSTTGKTTTTMQKERKPLHERLGLRPQCLKTAENARRTARSIIEQAARPDKQGD